jgi:tetratricopeptide (TPR) repeat protein
MKNKLRTFIGAILLAILMNGCATTGPGTAPKTNKYIAQAQEYEAEGEILEALEQYKLALTVEPDNPVATEKVGQIESDLKTLADDKYQTGLSYLDKGDYKSARQEFLTALRYNPDHAEAAKILRDHELKGKKIKGYVEHTIQPGESLSRLAQRYYGDYKKFHIIAEFNQMEDATRIRIGQKVQIPVVEELPFYAAPDDITTETGAEPATMIQEVVPVKRYIVHKVKSGESLSRLAKKYYGDYKKYPMIAKYNGLDENKGLRVGQKVRIPELEGVPFLDASIKKEQIQTEEPMLRSKEEIIPEDVPAQEPVEADDQFANYRELGIELFNKKDYPSAITEFEKILEIEPKDKVTLDYISRAYFEQGRLYYERNEYDEAIEQFESSLKYNPSCLDCKNFINNGQKKKREDARNKAILFLDQMRYEEAIVEFNKILKKYPDDTVVIEKISTAHFRQGMLLFSKKEYLAARDHFKSSLKYNQNCDKCSEYIIKCEATFKETHYNKGVAYYRQEKLNEAITEWQMVYDLDPEFKDVSSNLKKAKKLQERLETIRRSKDAK